MPNQRNAFVDEIKSAVNELADITKELLEKKELAKKEGKEILTELKNDLEKVKTHLENAVNEAKSGVKTSYDEIKTNAKSAFKEQIDKVMPVFDQTLETIKKTPIAQLGEGIDLNSLKVKLTAIQDKIFAKWKSENSGNAEPGQNAKK